MAVITLSLVVTTTGGVWVQKKSRPVAGIVFDVLGPIVTGDVS
jgi:hypothetical protein